MFVQPEEFQEIIIINIVRLKHLMYEIVVVLSFSLLIVLGWTGNIYLKKLSQQITTTSN